MVDHWHFSGGNIQWNLFFTILVQDWEVELVTEFF